MSSEGIYDVLIMGYGPVGATMANLLGQAGHHVAVAEMHAQIYDKPRAINLDQEALRLWQRIGIADEVADGCAQHPGTDFVGVDGELIKSIYSAAPPYPLGWPANLMFVQPEAERHLRTRVETHSNVEVFLEHRAASFQQTDEFVSVGFETSRDPKTMKARYLIGCDGANSPTRQWMAAQQTDLGFSEHWVVVDAWLTRETNLPPRTTQYCMPKGPTSYVVGSGTLRRWELKILPNENPTDYESLSKIKERLAPFVDVDALKFWRSSVYHFNARVADTWRDKRVFLAGDAAHTMPPFLGQGLNSGLRDAANLAWKLSSVLKGEAGDGLLETYQTERRPHILELTQITKGLGQIVGELDPTKALERDKRLRAEMAATGPVTVRQALIPPLIEGFFDSHSQALNGTLSPQPEITIDGNARLLDDLLSGFSLVELSADTKLLQVSTNIETESPHRFTCLETAPLMSDLLSGNQLTMVIVRPDGTIWCGGNDAHAAISRLKTALSHPQTVRPKNGR